MKYNPEKSASFLLDKLIRLDKIRITIPNKLPDFVIKQIIYEASNQELIIPDDFNWKYIVNNGKERGKLGARLASVIGVAGMYLTGVSYASKICNWEGFVDFHDKMDWKEGTFGDRDSCYFKREHNSVQRRNAMDARGVISFRTFKVNGQGLSRMWIVPNVPERGMMTMYNPYGLNGKVIAYIFTKTLRSLGINNIYCRPVSAKRCGCSRNNYNIYVNSGSDKAFVVGTLDNVLAHEDKFINICICPQLGRNQ